MSAPTPAVFITGGAGYLGGAVLRALTRAGFDRVTAADTRAPRAPLPGVEYLEADVRSERLGPLLAERRIEVVVHLASIVNPDPASDGSFEYSVDVLGTQNALKACLSAGVRRLVVSSSGAAYGYHADNPTQIPEDHLLRGNDEFPYSRHKRLVEEMLARSRIENPALEQTIFRLGTILGETTRNQITDLFDAQRIIAVRGAPTPFAFIWDEDAGEAFARACVAPVTGIYNLSGDGSLGIRDLARLMGKPVIELPASALRAALAVLKPLRLTKYGPEQLDFIRYRPVLDNRRLKEEFGFTPRLDSRRTFELFARARGFLRA